MEVWVIVSTFSLLRATCVLLWTLWIIFLWVFFFYFNNSKHWFQIQLIFGNKPHKLKATKKWESVSYSSSASQRNYFIAHSELSSTFSGGKKRVKAQPGVAPCWRAVNWHVYKKNNEDLCEKLKGSQCQPDYSILACSRSTNSHFATQALCSQLDCSLFLLKFTSLFTYNPFFVCSDHDPATKIPLEWWYRNKGVCAEMTVDLSGRYIRFWVRSNEEWSSADRRPVPFVQ